MLKLESCQILYTCIGHVKSQHTDDKSFTLKSGVNSVCFKIWLMHTKIYMIYVIWPRPFQGLFAVGGLALATRSTDLPNLKSLIPLTTKVWKAIQSIENGMV